MEAVHQAEELQPDLVLLDIGLLTLNGLDAARRMGTLAPRSRILFLSQDSSPDVVNEALRLGAMGFVQKSHAGPDLLPAMEAVLVGVRFVGSGLDGFEVSDDEAGSQRRHRHEIAFCSEDVAVVDSLARFIAAALNAGDAAILWATVRRLADDLIFGSLLQDRTEKSTERLVVFDYEYPVGHSFAST